MLNGIIFLNRNGLRWCDAPREYCPPKSLYNRWTRWGDIGIFALMMERLVSEGGEERVAMIDATYLKAHRKASSLRPKKGGRRSARAPDRAYEGRAEHQAACRCNRREGSSAEFLHDRRTGQRLHRCCGPAG